jgi:hypothetical protein
MHRDDAIRGEIRHSLGQIDQGHDVMDDVDVGLP